MANQKIKSLPWMKNLRQLREYWQTYGKVWIPVSRENGSVRSATFIKRQISIWDDLTPEQQDMLREVGVDNYADEKYFEKGFQLLKDRLDRHLGMNVPWDTVVDGFPLGCWAYVYHQNYNNPSFAVRNEQLEKLGFFDVHDSEHVYNSLVEYYNLNGNLFIPIGYTMNGINLYAAYQKLRRLWLRGKLPQEQLDKMDQITSDWTYRPKVSTSFLEQTFVFYLRKLGFTVENPLRDFEGISELDILVKDLGYVIEVDGDGEDKAHTKERLPREIKKDKKTLERTSFQMFRIRAYTVPEYPEGTGATVIRMKNLESYWYDLSKEVTCILKQILPPEYETAIDQLNIDVHDNAPEISTNVFEYMHRQWLEKYDIAREYFMEFGSLDVPPRCIYHGLRLRKWIDMQRSRLKAHTISKVEIDMLDGIGMIWVKMERKPHDNVWWFQQLEEYKTVYGGLLIPQNYRSKNGYHLGKKYAQYKHWYSQEETDNPKLTKEERECLKRLGIEEAMETEKEKSWNYLLEKLMEYYRENLSLKMGDDYVTEDGFPLGHKFSLIKNRCNHPEEYKRRFPESKKSILDKLDPSWCK